MYIGKETWLPLLYTAKKKARKKHRLPKARLSAHLSPLAMDKLKAEAERRWNAEGFHSSYGRILSDLIMRHLPPKANGEDDR